MVTFIVAAFVLGYACIALESVLKVNKAAPALLMCVACWVLYMVDPVPFISLMHGGVWQAFQSAFAGGAVPSARLSTSISCFLIWETPVRSFSSSWEP